MKVRFTNYLLFVVAALMPFSAASGQTVIQHLGANDPESQGFTRLQVGNPPLGPVLQDLGFDAWRIHSRTPGEGAYYHYEFTPAEADAVFSNGVVATATMRFVELSDMSRSRLNFTLGNKRFGAYVSASSTGEMVIFGEGLPAFTHSADPLAYHEYTFAYDALSDTVALWVNGVELASNISGTAFGGTFAPRFTFGNLAESVTHTHWNEVTLTIIPEPGTAALLAGAVALLAVGIWRRRLM